MIISFSIYFPDGTKEQNIDFSLDTYRDVFRYQYINYLKRIATICRKVAVGPITRLEEFPSRVRLFLIPPRWASVSLATCNTRAPGTDALL